MLCFKQPREKFLEGGGGGIGTFLFLLGTLEPRWRAAPSPQSPGSLSKSGFGLEHPDIGSKRRNGAFSCGFGGGDRGDAAQGPRVSLEDDTLQGVWGSQGHPCLLGSLNMYKPVCESHQPLAEWTEQDVHANEWKTSVGLQESGLSVFKQKRGKVIPGSRVGYAAPKWNDGTNSGVWLKLPLLHVII